MQALIIGGGIGGLAAAIALHRSGWRVQVLEQAAEFTEIGAGLSIQPNALRALDALELGDQVRAQAVTDAPVGTRRADGTWLIRNDVARLTRRYGTWATLHRADLLALLHRALPPQTLRPGVQVRQVRPDGTVVHSGGTSTPDVVVGADGLHSITRRSLWPDAPAPRYAGYTTFRMITAAYPVEGSVESWGQGDRFGYAPLADGRIYCYAMVTAPPNSTGGLADLRRRFAGRHNPIPALLESVEPDAVLQHDTYELPDLSTYATGRVALLGDAAHAMTPNLGQGAGQALEDAVVLARSLEAARTGDTTVVQALRAYDRARRPRTQMIARRSRQLGAMADPARLPLAARDAALRMAPASVFVRSMHPVLGWTG
ncbi:FAD-dependent monooxygenase [Actinomadura rugatobispora]|uniref:FAD-dependent monooxygenase n=1 Tax=Actinomadura rugatobispora TaxID=1994 RepID=A0ABW0ZU91_9ACTN|nr:FAD-dependent monooxygenase [Actinomadura rugatobispora]